jgi:hypothetical protein
MGEEANHTETAWSSINHSILSGFNYTCSVSLSSKALSRRRASSKDPVFFRGQQQNCRLLSFHITKIMLMKLQYFRFLAIVYYFVDYKKYIFLDTDSVLYFRWCF